VNGKEQAMPIFRVPLKEPTFLHCCPWWLLRQPAISEVCDCFHFEQKGNLAAIFNASNQMPVAIRGALRAFGAGHSAGMREMMEKNR
jgi:hypothetical protein